MAKVSLPCQYQWTVSCFLNYRLIKTCISISKCSLLVPHWPLTPCCKFHQDSTVFLVSSALLLGFQHCLLRCSALQHRSCSTEGACCRNGATSGLKVLSQVCLSLRSHFRCGGRGRSALSAAWQPVQRGGGGTRSRGPTLPHRRPDHQLRGLPAGRLRPITGNAICSTGIAHVMCW